MKLPDERPTHPDSQFLTEWAQALGEVTGNVVYLTTTNETDSMRVLKELSRAMREEQTNSLTPEEYKDLPTWGSCRKMMAASLRILLARLEGEERIPVHHGG